MKAVVFAGGYGTRISEETSIRPKPMVELGGMPILWHIMKTYEKHGINDFIICCGYKGHVIKEFFANYALNRADVMFDLANHKTEILKNGVENWRVTLVDSGEDTETGARLKSVEKYVGNETFCLTYGDGLTDLNITELIEFHKNHKKLATVTAVQPPGRFGMMDLQKGRSIVTNFQEKPVGDGGGWINGGYFVLEPEVFSYVTNDKKCEWQADPLRNLAHEGNLHAFRHTGFWHPMDTLRDKQVLEKMWKAHKAPWKVW